MIESGFGIAGGVFEIAVGVGGEVFSGGLSTALVVDGLATVIGNGAKSVAYLNGNNKIGDAIPGNFGSLVGKALDGSDFSTVGKAQSALGLANDVLLMITPTGDAGAMNDLIETPNTWNLVGLGTSYFGGTVGLKSSVQPVKDAYGN